MRTVILLYAIFFCSVFSFAQGINNLWLMGYAGGGGGINLDFTGGSLNITTQNRKMNFEDTNGTICDSIGKSLFYSNGIFIANTNGDTMINGSGLNPSTYTTMYNQDGLLIPQANLIIRFPGNPIKYYLFHQTIDVYGPNYTLHLYYSVIDMVQDGGKGAVIQKNVILFSDSLIPGHLTACKHANGRDWWLISHKNQSNRYYKFLITNTGILGPYIQDIGVVRTPSKGQFVFSPDGNYFASYDPSTDLDIFDFNRCTGNFTFKAHVDINDSAAAGGVAFSPNSQVLYVSSMSYVYQFDMNAANIAASQITVAVWDGYYSPTPPFASTFYLSQLAPDGKIYINCTNSTVDIHVINYPDSLGLACDLQQHSIHLPAYNAFTIPNHPNYFLGALSGSPCDTLYVDTKNAEIKVSTLRAFPNPVHSSGEITFTYSTTAETKSISIFNIVGKEMARYELPQWSSVQKVKLPELARGIYMARLSSPYSVLPAPNCKFVVE